MTIRNIVNRCGDTTATTGTGTVDIANAAPSGYGPLQTVAQAFTAGDLVTADTVEYVLLDANGTDWEVGIGTITNDATDTLTRGPIRTTAVSNAAITLTTGTHSIILTPGAERMAALDFGWVRLQPEPFTRDAADGYTLKGPCEIMVDGTVIRASGDTAKTSLSLTDASVYYIHVEDDGSGGITLGQTIASTSEPVWSDTNRYYRLASDEGKRVIGYFYTTATDTISVGSWSMTGIRSMVFQGGHSVLWNNTASDQSGSWQSTDISAFAPKLMGRKISIGLSIYGNSSDSAGVGISTRGDEGSWALGQHYGRFYDASGVGGESGVATAPMWLDPSSAQTIYYRFQDSDDRGAGVIKSLEYAI